MNPRMAFKVFIHYILTDMRDSGKIDLSDGDIEKFMSGAEYDPLFYDQLEEFLSDYIDDFGENYGLFDTET